MGKWNKNELESATTTAVEKKPSSSSKQMDSALPFDANLFSHTNRPVSVNLERVSISQDHRCESHLYQ